MKLRAAVVSVLAVTTPAAATDVPAGTCFLILFNKHVKTTDYVVEGTFSY